MAMGRLQLKIAEAFVSWAQRATPERRARAMTGPAGGLITAQIFAGMARSFDSEKGSDLDAVIRWEVVADQERQETWDLVIRGGRAHSARIRREETAEPRTTIGLDRPTLLELATGILNAPQAYLAGRVQMHGDVMLAQRLSTLLAIPGSRPSA